MNPVSWLVNYWRDGKLVASTVVVAEDRLLARWNASCVLQPWKANPDRITITKTTRY